MTAPFLFIILVITNYEDIKEDIKDMYKSKFNEYFQEILFFRGHHIYDTEHSVFRYNERVGKSVFLYEKLLKKGINWIIENNKDTKEDRYIFISKKYGFGIQVEWRRDRTTHKFGGFSATTLSENEMEFFKKKDKRLILEKIYTPLKLDENLKREFDLCGLSPFTEDGKIYYTFELVEV